MPAGASGADEARADEAERQRELAAFYEAGQVVTAERMRAIVKLTETLVPPPDGAGTPSHSPSETETPNSPELFASGPVIHCLRAS